MAGYFANWKRLLPRKLRPDSIEVAITLRAVITPMTEKTPMATPSMVRPERSLLVRRAVRAMLTVSLIPQGLDRIEPRGGARRQEAGKDPGDGGDDQADAHQPEGERHRERREGRGHGHRQQPGQDDADHAAHQADRHRLA